MLVVDLVKGAKNAFWVVHLQVSKTGVYFVFIVHFHFFFFFNCSRALQCIWLSQRYLWRGILGLTQLILFLFNPLLLNFGDFLHDGSGEREWFVGIGCKNLCLCAEMFDWFPTRGFPCGFCVLQNMSLCFILNDLSFIDSRRLHKFLFLPLDDLPDCIQFLKLFQQIV